MKKFDFGQLAYRFAHPVAALQAGMATDLEKYSKGHFDLASFDAQVFGKQAQMSVPDQNHDASLLPECEFAEIWLTCRATLQAKTENLNGLNINDPAFWIKKHFIWKLALQPMLIHYCDTLEDLESS